MGITPGLLDRAADTAGRRADRDVYRYRSSSDLRGLAASVVKGTLDTTGVAGGTLLAGVPILKAGSFHGGQVTLAAGDLTNMVDLFGILSPDVMVPPVRIDHSMSVLSVIGYISALSVETQPDPSNGGRATPYLLADLQILDDNALALIRLGLLRNRSSELWDYQANNGAVYPNALGGVAFVDLPAVEGLGAITLGRATPGLGAPHRIIELSEGGTVGADAGTEPVEEPEGTAAEVVGGGAAAGPADDAPTAAGAGEEVADATGAGGGDDAGSGPGEAIEPVEGERPDDPERGVQQPTPPGSDEPAGEAALTARRAQLNALGLSADAAPEEVLRALGLDRQADELAAAQRADLDRQVLGYADRGILGQSARPAARALLGHRDSSVRAHARTLLDNAVAPVKLGERVGHQESTSDNATGPRGDDAPTTATLAAAETLAELGEQWAALSRDQRREKTPERLAYEARRRELASA